MALYGAAAVASALSPSLTVLFISRFVWGFAAAGPGTLSQAMVRDQYSGEAMARVMTLMQTIFFLAPIVAPLIGKGFLSLGVEMDDGFGVLPAVIIAMWVLTIEETLDVENKRSLELGRVFEGFKIVVKNRVTFGYGLAVTFGFGAFYSFLGSTELVLEDIYDCRDQFFLFFSMMSVFLGLAAFVASRVSQRVSAKRLAFLLVLG